MANWYKTGWIRSGAVLCAVVLAGLSASAQESTNRVAAKTDWSVFVENDPTECWGVSAPKETVNTDTQTGRIKSVRRGDILLFVTFRPETGAAGEVSFTGGYPFAPGSTVVLSVGTENFDLFTSPSDPEWAWPNLASDDAALVAALKRGAEAVLTARSARGTTTKDTFSLLGFTAAMEEAEARCKE